MNPETLLAELTKMPDGQLYSILQIALENRKITAQYHEAADEFGNPTWAAKLAVVRHIMCG